MIKFNQVSFSYNNLVIIDNFTQEFENNKIHTIIAPSGAGKTTLLNLAAKLIKPQKGIIENLPEKVSYIFQEDRLIDELTIYQNLELVIKKTNKDKKQRKLLIDSWLKQVDLENYGNKYPSQLSGSMKRRVALVRAFIHPSQLILMDEPLTGLDINLKQEIINYLIKLWNKQKRTILFVTHNIDEALLLSNDIYVYSQKPMILKKHIEISKDLSERKLSKNSFSKERKVIYKTFEA